VLRSRFFKWGSFSLVGHLALFELTCGTPLFLFSVATMYSERTLTMASALYMAFVCSALVAVGAALFWYTFSKPRLERRDPK
jgi:membrane protein implicated in regulation of membrane protease activity